MRLRFGGLIFGRAYYYHYFLLLLLFFFWGRRAYYRNFTVYIINLFCSVFQAAIFLNLEDLEMDYGEVMSAPCINERITKNKNTTLFSLNFVSTKFHEKSGAIFREF